MGKQLEGPLTGYRVLDLADVKGAYCTKLLADMGAEVIKVEPPQGEPTRNIPPFAHDMPNIERSLPFLYRNANKLSITLNIETPDGQTIFKRLAEKADVVVESYPPGYLQTLDLHYAILAEVNRSLIMASITEFGQTGPYRDWKGSPIVDYALSCNMIESGFPDRPPCNMPGMAAYDSAAVMAAISIVISLFDRGFSGKGHYIDCSVYDNSRLALYPWAVTIRSYNTVEGSPPLPEVRTGPSVFPVYPCKDGYVRIVAVTPWQWKALLKAIGEPDKLCQPEWEDFLHRIFHADELYAIMTEYTMQYTMAELFESGQNEGVPIAPVYDVESFYNSPQTRARGFFKQMTHPIIGTFDYPEPPYKWTETPCTIRRAAPCLGEHNQFIYCDELGYSPDELAAMRRASVI